MGTVHLALCLCHSIPPAPAAFSIPVLPRQLLCLMPLLPLHRLGIPLFLLLLPCFSSFLSCYHSPHAPVLCLPPLAAAFERAAVYLSGLAAPLGRILPPHTAWSVLFIRHPCSLIPSQLRAPCGPEWHRTAFHQGQPYPPCFLTPCIATGVRHARARWETRRWDRAILTGTCVRCPSCFCL